MTATSVGARVPVVSVSQRWSDVLDLVARDEGLEFARRDVLTSGQADVVGRRPGAGEEPLDPTRGEHREHARGPVALHPERVGDPARQVREPARLDDRVALAADDADAPLEDL